jgi:excisionase family DNA binding protein
VTPRKRGRPTSSEYLSPREAAEMLTAGGFPVSARTVARMVDRGEIAAVRPGRYRRILKTTVEDFLARGIDTTASHR